jgi:tetratricopeptide (TPR) repeat protein
VTEHGPYGPLRAALEHEFQIEQVLEETPAGAAYLARDLALGRLVQVKAVHAVLAGAPRAAEFAREARLRASLSDPSIPAVHQGGTFGDFRYIVQEHPAGETLEERLRRGPLPPDELLRLGIHLLGALETAHAAGIVHSAVSPRNVIVTDGRYLLDGFGVATAGPGGNGVTGGMDGSGNSAVDGSGSGGTRMDGGRATAAAGGTALGDLQAVAGLLTESAGGKLPRAVGAAVGRALRADGQPSAAGFRDALEAVAHRATPGRPGKRVAIGAMLVAAAIYAAVELGEPPSPIGPTPRELAILPLEVDGGRTLDPVGSNLAHLIQLELEEVPGLTLTPRGTVDRWWESQEREAEAVDGFSATRALRTRWVAHGSVDHRPDGMLRVRLSLYDSSGTTSTLPEVRGAAGDLAALGDSLSLGIIRILAPRSDRLYEPVGGFSGVPLPALKAFLKGEAAFARDAWATAQRHYEIALEIDSTFALADWRRSNVLRWRRLPYQPDLEAVYRRHAGRLRPRDRMLMEALLEPDLVIRLAKLDTVIQRLPTDAYARLLQGEELIHRGPLAGRGLDEGLQVMAAAVALDSSLALAHDHLVLGHVRFGRREEARRALELRRRVGRDPLSDLDLLPFLELVYDERFAPWRAWLRYRYIAWRKDHRQLEGVEKVARAGTPWIDMPLTQLRYCDLLLRAAPPSAELHATAHQGKGLALFAMGRIEEAFAEIDSAVALFDSPEARLQQAEWRLVPSALGYPGLPTEEWERRLAQMVDDAGVGGRAAWALALGRIAAGDTVEAARWSERLEPGSPLRVLVEAGRAASRGDFAAALAATDSVRLAFQVTRPPDPFAGAVFHLLRGEWHAQSGNAIQADREWLWYEASDVEGWPVGLAQAGEIDGALGTFARLKRARALLDSGGSAADSAEACRRLARVRKLWTDATAALRPLSDEAAALAGTCRA